MRSAKLAISCPENAIDCAVGYREEACRSVVGDDLPPSLFEFVCQSCQSSVLTAVKQKRYEKSRKEIVEKLHRVSAPTCNILRAEDTVKLIPRRQPSQPQKRHQLLVVIGCRVG